MNGRYRFFSIATALILVIATIIVIGWFFVRPAPMILQGEAEAKQIKVSSKVAGRIGKLFIKEGDEVATGQLLIALDTPELRAKLLQAKAAQRAASAQSAKAKKGERKENIQAAYNSWMKAKAASDLAVKTNDRIAKLYADGVVPAQKKDEAEAQMTAAIETEKAARVIYEMAETGARDEDKAAAQALVDQASGAVSEVESYLGESGLKSPGHGEVATIVVQEGELVSPGLPIVNIVDLSDIWITFNLREDLMPRIRMGEIVKAEFPALGGRIVELKISYIGPLGSYATWNATKTKGEFDMKTFEVRARPTKEVDGLRPGMSALLNWDELKSR